MLRAMIVSCAAAALMPIAPAFAEPSPAPEQQCQNASFRIYFAPGETTLSSDARRTLDAAQNAYGDCVYAEAQIRVDNAGEHARERGEAVLSALSARGLNVAGYRAGWRSLPAAYIADAPDYVEVIIDPDPLDSPAVPHVGGA